MMLQMIVTSRDIGLADARGIRREPPNDPKRPPIKPPRRRRRPPVEEPPNEPDQGDPTPDKDKPIGDPLPKRDPKRLSDYGMRLPFGLFQQLPKD